VPDESPVPPQRPGGRFLGTFVSFILIAGLFIAGVWIGGHPRQTGLDRLTPGVRDVLLSDDRTAVSSEVLSILEQDYYKPLDAAVLQKAEDASAAALVAAIGDPYSVFMTKDEYAKFLDARAGTYVGVGIEWHPEGEYGRIVRVVPGGPADRAGIKAADVIIAVDGKPVLAKNKYAAMSLVKGKDGTKVTLRIVRGKAKPRDFTMTRAEIHERVVDARIDKVGDANVGYVRLDRFTTGSAKAVRNAVQGFAKQKVSGVVLDLRGDPGGLVDEAVDVVGIFLPKGSPVVTEKPRNGDPERLSTDDSPVIDGKIPLVILLDQNSASASEIVAGALRDAGRAKLVGDRTFGKALIQSTRMLPGGGALKYTVASYLTPDGFDLGTRGLAPDVKIADNPKTAADEVLQTGLRLAAQR
jgi:carboxyl-terminal processing protease